MKSEENTKDVGVNDGSESSIWSQVLSQVSKHKFVQRGNIVVLGDRNSGKKSLFCCMNGVKGIPGYDENFTTTHPMGYTYLDIADPEEEKVKSSFAEGDVWFLNDSAHMKLLDFALGVDRLDKTLIVIALDLSQPWAALDQLNTWLDVIRNSFARIKKSSPGTQETFQKCSQVLKDYVRLFRAQQILGSKTEEETKSIDLSEGVLTENFGLPVIVCGTKVDLLESSLAGKKLTSGRSSPLSTQLQPKINFIQYKLRQLCLGIGATLVFTSASESTNTITLQKYIFHRLYPDEFKISPTPEVLNQNSLFIPSGWDAIELLDDLVPSDGLINKNLDYEIVIPNLSSKKTGESKKKEDTITAYPEDVFLQRLYDKQTKDDRLLSSAVSDAKLRGAVSEMSGKGGAVHIATTTNYNQSRRKSLADSIGKRSSSHISGKSGAGSKVRSGDSIGKATGTNPTADPKENPKLIKNFFQSLLKEPRKSTRGSSRTKKKS